MNRGSNHKSRDLKVRFELSKSEFGEILAIWPPRFLRVAPLQNEIDPKSFFFLIPKRKVKQKVRKTPRNVPEKNLSPVQLPLNVFHRHFFTVVHPQFQHVFKHKFNLFSQQDSAGMATLTISNHQRVAICDLERLGLKIPQEPSPPQRLQSLKTRILGTEDF